MLLVVLLQIITMQDREPIHGPFQGTEVNNILTQMLVEVAVPKLTQCIPHKSSNERRIKKNRAFKRSMSIASFVSDMDSIGLNIKIRRRAIIKSNLCDYQILI